MLEQKAALLEQNVAELELTLKHAHNDNVVAKRDAKKLLRQAHP